MPAGFTPLVDWARSNARIRNEYVTGFIGEFLGNFILCLFASGASASVVMGASHMQAVFGGVFGLMIAVTVFGGLSGAHINPAVTFGLAITGYHSWLKVPVYWVAQLLGSYAGSGVAYSLYEYQLVKHLEHADIEGYSDLYYKTIIGVFSSPPTTTPLATSIADQIVVTAVLFSAIMAAIDHRNMKVPTHMFGIFFALVVAGVAFTFHENAGGSMNPARDLGPRLMAVSIGCKAEDVFKSQPDKDGDRAHYWLAPMVGPMVGAFIGALIYVFLVGSHLRDTEEELKEAKMESGSDDWRSTRFIPKVNQSAGPQNNNSTFGNGALPVFGGVQNQGFVKDDGLRQNY